MEQFYPRQLQKKLEGELKNKNILTLAGSRQVGKTVLLHLLFASEELKNKTKIFFDLENIHLLRDLNDLNFDNFPEYVGQKLGVEEGRRIYVFMDEIQYLDNPSSFLKYIHDHFPKIKFIVSGSSTLEIKKKFKDRLTGRKSFYEVMPLSFDEFLLFKNKKSLLLTRQKFKKDKFRFSSSQRIDWIMQEMLMLYEEFVRLGGYPKIVLTKTIEEKTKELNEIYNTYVKKDIKDLAAIGNITAFNGLIEILASQIGSLVNLQELANTLKAARETIEEYLFLLENTFIIDLVRPYFTNKRKEITKMPKVYFRDTGLRNMLLGIFTPHLSLPGSLVENAIYLELKKNLSIMQKIFFWRTQFQAEVDFVLKEGQELLPIEIKYQSLQKPIIPSGLKGFIETYSPERAIVVTKDFCQSIIFRKTRVYFLPAFLV